MQRVDIMDDNKTTTTIKCDVTGVEAPARLSTLGEPILPRGWRRFQNMVWSDRAWHDRYHCVAITMPVIGPIDGTWAELREALKVSWSQSTALSNWATTELFARDVRRETGMEKLPPMPPVNLYQDARARFPDMPTGSLSGVLQSVTLKYRSRRFGVIWTCDQSLPNYRYPTPFPARRQDWKPEYRDDDMPVVAVRLAGKRWHLQLRRGKGFRRQYAAFQKLMTGEALGTELALYRVRANSGDHRNGIAEKQPGGGQTVSTRVMCKIVMWLPKKDRADKRGSFSVATGGDSLLRAIDADDRVWSYHADHIRRWIAQHSKRLQHLADDRKAERRRPRRRGIQLQDYMDKITKRQHDRLATLIDQVSASLAGYASRRNVATVYYDDTDQSYVPSFPWAALREKVAQKLNALGIAMELGGLTVE